MSSLPKDIAFDCVVVCEAAAKVFDEAGEVDLYRATRELTGYICETYDVGSVGYLQGKLLEIVGWLAGIKDEDAFEVAGEISELNGRLQTTIGVGLVGRIDG